MFASDFISQSLQRHQHKYERELQYYLTGKFYIKKKTVIHLKAFPLLHFKNKNSLVIIMNAVLKLFSGTFLQLNRKIILTIKSKIKSILLLKNIFIQEFEF